MKLHSVKVMAVGMIMGSALAANGPECGSANSLVDIKTNRGDIILKLNPEKSPITVANFCAYVKAGKYDGTIFHRVIPNFMIQGGGFTRQFQKVKTDKPIKNEANNGLKNTRGTIAMARTSIVNSATNQFFINLKDNPFLNHRGPALKYGYAVFGRVVKGIKSVVDGIAQIPTTQVGPFQNAPVKLVVIEKVSVISASELSE